MTKLIATELTAIMPKLTTEQREWVMDLSSEEQKWTIELIISRGEAYFFENFARLRDQLEYIRTL